MKRILTGAFGVAALSGLVCFCAQAFPQETRNQGEQNPRVNNTFSIMATRAKANGQDKIELLPPIEPEMYAPSFSYVLGVYSLLVVEPKQTETIITGEDTHMMTWYKCTVVEELFSRPPISSSISISDYPPTALPNRLLPLIEHEILIPRAGGSLARNGVTITMKGSAFPFFEIGKRYLIIGSLSRDGRVLITPLRAAGVFNMDASGKFGPFTEDDHPLVKDVLDYAADVSHLRVKLGTPQANRK